MYSTRASIMYTVRLGSIVCWTDADRPDPDLDSLMAVINVHCKALLDAPFSELGQTTRKSDVVEKSRCISAKLMMSGGAYMCK